MIEVIALTRIARRSRWVTVALASVLAVAVGLLGAAPASAVTTTYAYDTAIYVYDAPARLSSPDGVARDARGSRSGPEASLRVSPVSVRDRGVAAESVTTAARPAASGAKPPTSMTSATGLARQLAGEEASSIFTETGVLKPEIIASSREIISGSDLGNPAVIQELTSNGSNIADWSKYATPTFESPLGPFQAHFYYNSAEQAANWTIDYKVVFNNGIQRW